MTHKTVNRTCIIISVFVVWWCAFTTGAFAGVTTNGSGTVKPWRDGGSEKPMTDKDPPPPRPFLIRFQVRGVPGVVAGYLGSFKA